MHATTSPSETELTLEFAPDELETITKAAETLGVSIEEFIRRATAWYVTQ